MSRRLPVRCRRVEVDARRAWTDPPWYSGRYCLETLKFASLSKFLLALFELGRGCPLPIERAPLSMNDLAGALDK